MWHSHRTRRSHERAPHGRLNLCRQDAVRRPSSVHKESPEHVHGGGIGPIASASDGWSHRVSTHRLRSPERRRRQRDRHWRNSQAAWTGLAEMRARHCGGCGLRRPRPFSWHVSTARGLACGHSPRPGCGRSLIQARHRLALQRSVRSTNRLSPRPAGVSEIIRCWCVFFGACRACREEAQWNLHGCNIGDMRGAVRLAEDQALIISHEGSSTTEDPTYA